MNKYIIMGLILSTILISGCMQSEMELHTFIVGREGCLNITECNTVDYPMQITFMTVNGKLTSVKAENFISIRDEMFGHPEICKKLIQNQNIEGEWKKLIAYNCVEKGE